MIYLCGKSIGKPRDTTAVSANTNK